MRALFLISIMIFSCTACNPTVQPAQQSKWVQLEDIGLRYQPAVLETETPLALTITTPADWVLIKAELVGLSMDMLTMPLFFRQQMPDTGMASQPELQASSPAVAMGAQTQWQTQFLLGACADPQMRWRLELQFRDSKGQIKLRQDEFVVNRR